MSQHTSRRLFLRNVGLGSLGALAAGGLVANAGAQPPDAKILGAAGVKTTERPKGAWKPVSDRKIRVGIVGYGVCQFGAAFGFQDHPNVKVVAVSDLMPDRCRGLAKACRCEKTSHALQRLLRMRDRRQLHRGFVPGDAQRRASPAAGEQPLKESLRHGDRPAADQRGWDGAHGCKLGRRGTRRRGGPHPRAARDDVERGLQRSGEETARPQCPPLPPGVAPGGHGGSPAT